MNNIVNKKEEPTEVIAHDVEPLTVNTDAGAFAKLGWLIVLLGFGGFMLWALFAPLDRGVPMQGTVAKESNRKAVQSLAGGTVDDILAKDGDVVKAGQVLVRMNAVTARSQAEVTRGQYINARAAEARLVAELEGHSRVTFPPALTALKNDSRVVAAFALQEQLFSARQAAQRDDLRATDAAIEGVKAQIESLKESREGSKAQLVILKEQLDSMRELAKDGYVARSRMLEVERSYLQVNAAISEANGNLARNQGQMEEASLRRAQRVQEYNREVRATLADTRRDAEALEARLQQLDYELANVDVKSPADGVVTSLAVFTRGGVVASGYKLMEVVPTADAFIVEGQLPVNLVDKVQAGLKVELNFSAFNAHTTPHIPGEVVQVAADRTVDERTGMPYYKVRVRVLPEGAKIIATKKLDVQPGMPVDLFVKTGERSMMNYLFKPLMDRAKTAMTEE